MGIGFPISSSTKQKLNTRSSKKSDIVGVNNFIPSILRTRNFLNVKDCGVTKNIIFQDNKSAIIMNKNGKSSSGKRKKHINIRFF